MSQTMALGLREAGADVEVWTRGGGRGKKLLTDRTDGLDCTDDGLGRRTDGRDRLGGGTGRTGRTDGQTMDGPYGWMDGQTDGWMDWTDGLDGRT